MAVQTFSDLYLGQCEHCGDDLQDWEWLVDEMVFYTTCTCGTDHILEPTTGILESEVDETLNEDADEDE